MRLFLLLATVFLLNLENYSVELRFVKERFKSEKVNFSIDSFVDARINKQLPVGFTKIGLKNEVEKMVLPAAFGAYCKEFFSTAPIAFNARQKFMAVIRHVTVQELFMQGNEYSDCSVSIDYYQLDPETKSYKLFYESYRKSVAGPVIDATAKHAKNLSDAFLVSFLNLSEFISGKSSPAKVFNTKTSLENFELINLKSIRNTRDTILLDGIYYSPWQLLTNQPSDLKNLPARINLELLENYLDDEIFSPYSSCYAFVKSGQLYTCVRKNIFHRSALIFASKKLLVLDVQNKKSSLRNPGYYYAFGITGAVIEDISNELRQSGDKDLIIDLQTGLMLN